jgi:hypothetical protein
MSQIADWVAGIPSRPGRNRGISDVNVSDVDLSDVLGVPLTAMPTQTSGLNLGLSDLAAP